MRSRIRGARALTQYVRHVWWENLYLHGNVPNNNAGWVSVSDDMFRFVDRCLDEDHRLVHNTSTFEGTFISFIVNVMNIGDKDRLEVLINTSGRLVAVPAIQGHSMPPTWIEDVHLGEYTNPPDMLPYFYHTTSWDALKGF